VSAEERTISRASTEGRTISGASTEGRTISGVSAEGRTVIVSNRLPVQASVVDGRIRLQPSGGGGLVTGLEGVHGSGRSVWVGCLGGSDPKALGVTEQDARTLRDQGLITVDVPRELYDAYYEGFSNDAIWPLFHYMTDRCHFSGLTWEAYRRVNEAFADAVLDVVEDGDEVWIHDYQLMLLPDMLRRRKRDLTIGFFLHVPFPSTEVFRVLPWRREILVGLLGADLVGFHTLEYVRHFANSIARIMGLETQMDTATYNRRTVRFGAFPLGINVRALTDLTHSASSEKHFAELRETYADRRVVLGVDRLDYTKGIPERLAAYAEFLERFPEWVGKVSLVQLSVPSRVNVREYQELKAKIDALVGEINGEYGMPGYVPVHYVFRNLEKEHLFALYRCADVALVTPLRDGLNLVCKEYVAAKGGCEPGALVLSEFAGAAAEMGEALLVNPWSKDSVVAGLGDALDLDTNARVAMMSSLYQRLSRHDNRAWSREFLAALRKTAKSNRASGSLDAVEPNLAELIERVRRFRRVFFFIDYDGTLVPLVDKPELAVPSRAIRRLLADMAAIPSFRVAVVSGRDRDFLAKHLPDVVTIVAEHGACIRRAGELEELHLVDETSYRSLRDNVYQVMSDFESRIPGSLIEEKQFGLVWHYRMADPIFAHQQALVLADTLGGLLQHTALGVLMSKKAVEVRHVGVNKGEAVRAILDDDDFDPRSDALFTLGDDRTDEDMFRVYPEVNLSIGAGDGATAASYTIDQPRLVELLADLTRSAAGWQYDLWERA